MKLLSFKNRINRLEHFFILLFAGLSYISLVIVTLYILKGANNLFVDTVRKIIFIIATLIFAFVKISVQVRRFHDLNKHGALYLTLLIPIYNIFILASLFFERGTPGNNNYGKEPNTSSFYSTKKAIINMIILAIGLIIINWILLDLS